MPKASWTAVAPIASKSYPGGRGRHPMPHQAFGDSEVSARADATQDRQTRREQPEALTRRRVFVRERPPSAGTVRAAIALGTSGLRIGEVLGLTADRVNVENPRGAGQANREVAARSRLDVNLAPMPPLWR